MFLVLVLEHKYLCASYKTRSKVSLRTRGTSTGWITVRICPSPTFRPALAPSKFCCPFKIYPFLSCLFCSSPPKINCAIVICSLGSQTRSEVNPSSTQLGPSSVNANRNVPPGSMSREVRQVPCGYQASVLMPHIISVTHKICGWPSQKCGQTVSTPPIHPINKGLHALN